MEMEIILTKEIFDAERKRGAKINYKEIKNKLRFLSTTLIPFNPDIGFYLTVNGIDIGERAFPEEFAQINKIFFNVLEKTRNFTE